MHPLKFIGISTLAFTIGLGGIFLLKNGGEFAYAQDGGIVEAGLINPIPNVIDSVVEIKVLKEVEDEKHELTDADKMIAELATKHNIKLHPFTSFSGGLGSGVFIDKDLIVTNHHVIDGADEIVVVLNNSKRIKGQVIGSTDHYDLALIKVDEQDVNPIPLADFKKVKLGDPVYAIGSPFGNFNSVSKGIVSAFNRQIGPKTPDNLIQTDAPINHGNSGGPLLNAKGELIGINEAIYTESENQGSIGIGFAIPVETVKNYIQAYKDHVAGRPEANKPNKFIGILLKDADGVMVDSLNLPDRNGTFVVRLLSNSPNKDVLREGDFITSFNGKIISSSDHFIKSLADVENDKKIPVTVIRDGKKLELEIISTNSMPLLEDLK